MKTSLVSSVVLLAALATVGADSSTVPATKLSLEGFKPLFNGRDTSGWHWSRIVHHGSVATAKVENGAIALYQEPFGQGGLLLTDKRYKNFELYLETDLPPSGFNSGIFLRSSEGGSAYQVELTGGAGTVNLISENMPLSVRATASAFAETWKTSGWNSIRVRVEGDAPRMILWLNDVQMWDVQQTKNDKIAGETDGFIGIQTHWTAPTSAAGGNTGLGNWPPGGALRFRNLYIKEL